MQTLALIAVALVPAVAAERPAVPERRIRGSADRHQAHHLDAARDHEVVDTGHHGCSCKLGCLLGRATLPVDRDTRDALRKPSREPRRARHVDRLRSDLVDAAEDDVVDVRGVDPGPLDERGQHMSAEVGRMNLGKAATAPPHRGAYCLNDECVWNVRASLWTDEVSSRPALTTNLTPIEVCDP